MKTAEHYANRLQGDAGWDKDKWYYVRNLFAEAMADARRATVDEARAQLYANAQRHLDQARKFMRGGDERSEELNRQIAATLEVEAGKLRALLDDAGSHE